MMRNIKNEKCKISQTDQNGIIELYEALVPRSTIQFIDVNKIRERFPTFEDVDIDMIVEEAFPAFERTIGVENFEKVKKHFGIGYRKCFFNKNKKQKQEMDDLLTKLRTIENAQYYISGYKHLISQIAQTLEGAPEKLTDLEKAKIVRLFFIIYYDNCFFCEDYEYSSLFKNRVVINYEKIFINNKYDILPEELFVLYHSRLINLGAETIFYDFVLTETLNLDKRTLKEVLKFSELEIDANDQFTSSISAGVKFTFGNVRNLKMRINSEPEIFPLEMFAMKNLIPKYEFYDLYMIYKIVKIYELTDFEMVDKPFKKVEGSRVVESMHPCYQLTKQTVISGEREKMRIIRFIEYIASRGLTVFSKYDINKETFVESSEGYSYNAKHFFSAVMFANDAEYLSAGSSIERDFEIAVKFIEMDKTNALEEYFQSEGDNISVEEMKQRLGINDAFEFEFFGIEKKVDLSKVVSKFAIENGYVCSEEEIDYSIIENVIIPGNEEFIEQYNDGRINASKLANKIGFTHEFGEMFFNLAKINMDAIEAKLLEVKKLTSTGQKKINHNLKLLVLLYCYIIENEIECGPKMRLPKRNKALKPSNLKMFIS